MVQNRTLHPKLFGLQGEWQVREYGRWALGATRLAPDVYLLHRGFVQLIEIQRIDAVLGPKYQVLI